MDWPGWDKIVQKAVKEVLDAVTVEIGGRDVPFQELAVLLREGKIVEVVRCRDCAHKWRDGCSLTLEGQYNGDNWFCADGKRRSEEHGEAGEWLEGATSASE